MISAGQGQYTAVSLCHYFLLTHFQCSSMGWSIGCIPIGGGPAPVWVLHGLQSLWGRCALAWAYSWATVPLGSICSGMGLFMGCSPFGVYLLWCGSSTVHGPFSGSASTIMEHLLLLWPWCFPCCFSLFLFTPLSVWHFLPFLKYVFRETPQTHLAGSALVHDGPVTDPAGTILCWAQGSPRPPSWPPLQCPPLPKPCQLHPAHLLTNILSCCLQILFCFVLCG